LDLATTLQVQAGREAETHVELANDYINETNEESVKAKLMYHFQWFVHTKELFPHRSQKGCSR
jgi:hypothetical protein